jgi:hypothetical protein
MTFRTSIQVGVFSAIALLAACSRDSRPAEEPAPASAYDPTNEAELRPASRAASAAESITEARCAREQRCENIGADKKYSSFADCSARIKNDWKDELNARECPGGVDQKELDECLASIRNEDCNSPFDTLGRLSECMVAPICESDSDRPNE